MAYQPRIVRGSTTLDLTTANGIVLAKPEESAIWRSSSGGRIDSPGGIIEESVYEGEDLVLRGLLRGATLASTRTRLATLLHIFGDQNADLTFTMQDDRQLLCRCVDRSIEWYPAGNFLAVQFEATLRSLDPYWRATSDDSFTLTQAGNGEGTVVVSNTGDAPTWPIVDLYPSTGSLANCTVVVQRDLPTPIEKIRVGRITVASGKKLRIDFRTGAVTDETGALGMATALGELFDGRCFRLEPGSNTIRLRVNGDAGANSVRMDGTYRRRFYSL